MAKLDEGSASCPRNLLKEDVIAPLIVLQFREEGIHDGGSDEHDLVIIIGQSMSLEEVLEDGFSMLASGYFRPTEVQLLRSCELIFLFWLS